MSGFLIVCSQSIKHLSCCNTLPANCFRKTLIWHDHQLCWLLNIDLPLGFLNFNTHWQGATEVYDGYNFLSSAGIGETETVPVPTCSPENQPVYCEDNTCWDSTIHTHIHTYRQFRAVISQPGLLVLPGFFSAVAKGYLERLKWSSINLSMNSLESAVTLNGACTESINAWCDNGQKAIFMECMAEVWG